MFRALSNVLNVQMDENLPKRTSDIMTWDDLEPLDEINEPEPDEHEEWDYPSSFEGICICDHSLDEHGWGECDSRRLDGCPCPAGWVE